MLTPAWGELVQRGGPGLEGEELPREQSGPGGEGRRRRGRARQACCLPGSLRLSIRSQGVGSTALGLILSQS